MKKFNCSRPVNYGASESSFWALKISILRHSIDRIPVEPVSASLHRTSLNLQPGWHFQLSNCFFSPQLLRLLKLNLHLSLGLSGCWSFRWKSNSNSAPQFLRNLLIFLPLDGQLTLHCYSLPLLSWKYFCLEAIWDSLPLTIIQYWSKSRQTTQKVSPLNDFFLSLRVAFYQKLACSLSFHSTVCPGFSLICFPCCCCSRCLRGQPWLDGLQARLGPLFDDFRSNLLSLGWSLSSYELISENFLIFNKKKATTKS